MAVLSGEAPPHRRFPPWQGTLPSTANWLLPWPRCTPTRIASDRGWGTQTVLNFLAQVSGCQKGERSIVPSALEELDSERRMATSAASKGLKGSSPISSQI